LQLRLQEEFQELQRSRLTAEQLKQALLDLPESKAVLEVLHSPALAQKYYSFCFAA